MENLTINGITYTMTATDSKAITGIGYDRTSETLCIVFKYAQDKAYIYSNVNYQKNTWLANAESYGSHFHAKIRPFAEKYPFETFAI